MYKLKPSLALQMGIKGLRKERIKIFKEILMGISETDVKRMYEISEDFSKKAMNGDSKGIANLYTKDACLMPPGHPPVSGRENIQKWAESSPNLTKFEFQFEDVKGYDDMAYVRGSYLMEFTPEESHEPIVDRGKFLEIRRKQDDGSWPISVDIWNSDQM